MGLSPFKPFKRLRLFMSSRGRKHQSVHSDILQPDEDEVDVDESVDDAEPQLPSGSMFHSSLRANQAACEKAVRAMKDDLQTLGSRFTGVINATCGESLDWHHTWAESEQRYVISIGFNSVENLQVFIRSKRFEEFRATHSGVFDGSPSPPASPATPSPPRAPPLRKVSLLPRPIGEEDTLEFRLQTLKQGEKPVSLWHDLPLKCTDPAGNHDGTYNFVCEIPKCTRRKYEIATDEVGTPIKQDTKKGALRYFKRGDLAFNYGCLPQTWEDPDVVHLDAGVGGDNDPLDVCEIGMQQVPTGAVRSVKILGVLCMIDDGEADWKLVAIDRNDPWAARVNDVDDVERVLPGTIHAIREWFRLYKIPDGKPENVFGLGEKCMDAAYARGVIDETHEAWRKLVTGSRIGAVQSALSLSRRQSMVGDGGGSAKQYYRGGGMQRKSVADVLLRGAKPEQDKGAQAKKDDVLSIQSALPYAVVSAAMPNVVGVDAGEVGTLAYRLNTVKAEDTSKPVSLWHDIPLYSAAGGARCNFVNEIPKWTRSKYEIATDEVGTPIKQDTKKGALRYFKRGDLAFNYGCLPQTWEDPDVVHLDAGVGGDNDPLDVCEIGMQQVPTGAVRSVKILGVLCMIDDGEADWKLVAIDETDPWAERLNDIQDVELHMPGVLHTIREWFRLYKVPDGKPENVFGLGEAFMNKEYAMGIVAETNEAWRALVDGSRAKRGGKPTALFTNRRVSMMAASKSDLPLLRAVGARAHHDDLELMNADVDVTTL